MATEVKDALPIFLDTITLNLRHQDYKRVTEIAEDFTTYATGHGIDKKLKQFNGRETDAAFKQRVALTQANTPDIFQSCIKPLYKVGRTPANIKFQWSKKEEKDTDDRKKELLEVGSNFWGKKSVTQYITQRQGDLDSTDPNSFVVVEFEGVVNPADPKTKARPYPFEVNAAEAINYIYRNNELQWLIVLNHILIRDKKGNEHQGEKYFMYIDNEAITAREITRDNFLDLTQAGTPLITQDNAGLYPPLVPLTEYLYEAKEKKQSKKRFFVVRVTEHKIGFVPAKRFGTVLDPVTRCRTCVPLVFAAQCYFEKSIKTMSEFDLTNCLHTFPQKIQYSDPCPGEMLELEGGGYQHVGCDRGLRVGGKDVCGACNGTGFKVHTSAQDIIQIRMPKDISEIVSLENILVYKHPPIDLIKFQKDFGFVELRQAAQNAVYNSDVFSRQEIATTATEKVINLDAVYDTLTPFADTWSELFVHIYRCIAKLRDMGEVLITHDFPEDFKMRSFTDLLDDLKKAADSGAPSHIKKALVRDLLRKLYVDSPQEVLKIETREKFNPFPGKSEQDVALIIANGQTTKYFATLYTHFDIIFSEIEYEQGKKDLDFYQMDEEKQRAIIKEKTDSILAALTTEQDEAAAKEFENAPDGEGEEEDEPAGGTGA